MKGKELKKILEKIDTSSFNDECSCPCHSGITGFFHCFGVCCSEPDKRRRF